MKEQLEQAITVSVKNVFDVDSDVVLTRPDEQFGDYATNVALQLAKQVGKNPREIAETIKAELQQQGLVKEVTVAGPGFLNIILSDDALLAQVSGQPNAVYGNQKILLEYSCPNAFKELHTGHLYQTVVGDALGRILETAGADVFRANFGGDVGLHVGKCLYGIREALGGDMPEKLADIPENDRPNWISKAYVAGSKAYEDDEHAKNVIETLNKAVYEIHTANDRDSALAQMYWTCREWSYDYFKAFYEQIAVAPFDKYYPESQTSTPGLGVVNSNQQVFQQSNGAVVFDGESIGLHTRVFITSQGLPTYETKDLGVIYTEANDFAFDKRIIMTGNDQSEYMKVVFAALTAIDESLGKKQTHLTNGTVRFADGQKMSSRLGNVSRAVDVLDVVSESVKQQQDAPELVHDVTLGAIKYSFLKHRLGGDIAFDISESVSLEGNSGPYLQYAHARARSIIRKSNIEGQKAETLDAAERSLVRVLSQYTETIERAAHELLPHVICTYLYELSQAFNRFYEHNRVIGDEREATRLFLVQTYADTLKNGLGLLGITAPDYM
jgi:arginyl-tRNA synthetase